MLHSSRYIALATIEHHGCFMRKGVTVMRKGSQISKSVQSSHPYFLKQFSTCSFINSQIEDDNIDTEPHQLDSFQKTRKVRSFFMEDDLENCLNKFRKNPKVSDAIFLLRQREFSFEQQMEIYKQAVAYNLKQQILLKVAIIDVCFKLRKHDIMKVLVHELVELMNSFSKKTKEEQRDIVVPNMWNSIVACLTHDKDSDKEGIYWYHYFVEQGYEGPKKFVLQRMLKVFSRNGDYDQCKVIMNQLKNMDKATDVSYSVLLKSLCKSKSLTQAMTILEEMKEHNIVPEVNSLISLAKLCSEKKAFEEGKKIQTLATHEYPNSIELKNTIIHMYIACRHIEEAIEMCKQMKHDGSITEVTYNCWIQAKISQNDIYGAIEILNEMETSKVEPNSSTFAILISACAKHKLLEEGKKIHEKSEQHNKYGAELTSSIMNLYMNCGKPEIAVKFFTEIKHNQEAMDVETWNMLIRAYLALDHVREAVDTIREMKLNGYEPNGYSFGSLINACAKKKLFEEGKYIIEVASMFEHVVNLLDFKTEIVHFYWKLGDMTALTKALSDLRQQKNLDSTAYNLLIIGYTFIGQTDTACEILHEAISKNSNPQSSCMTILLKKCAYNGDVVNGEKVIELIKRLWHWQSDEHISAIMIKFYGKTKQLEKLMEVYEQIVTTRVPNIETWNQILLGFCNNNQPQQALHVFNRLIEMKVEPTEKTVSTVLMGLMRAGLVHECQDFYEHCIATVWRGKEPPQICKNIMKENYSTNHSLENQQQ
ncbi:hypothetical protein C9374_012091 [Naegleria lovaniensis]|uniref:Pentatricopeptide repeat-containing protein-mitochondrial domain-containing protein n=1 Tax=Naegleria lovaniensis TaxID=51637 RepID=A0AA88GF74_NAELO|nr:uncharacterized protein C9374_012091 [Naegleria lovaniensis]KAG2373484.1 hypothetical protein C9374_012091 [Naegleria lovaniensis]